jgi:hypothetical protein
MAILAFPFPVFQPAMRIIAAITKSFPLQVTTTFAHQYKNGTIVRLDIPYADGMQQLNLLFAPITVTGATTFTMPIDSTGFDPFVIPMGLSPHINTNAVVVPIGEISSTLAAAVQNVLPYL